MKKIFLLFLLFTLLSFTSCVEDVPTSRINDDSYNRIFVSNQTNKFLFQVSALNLTLNETYNVNYFNDTLTVEVIVSEYKGGRGALLLMETVDTLFVKEFSHNDSFGLVREKIGDPKRLKIELQNFSGKLSLSVAHP